MLPEWFIFVPVVSGAMDVERVRMQAPDPGAWHAAPLRFTSGFNGHLSSILQT